MFQRQRTDQSGAPPNFLAEISEHNQSEEAGSSRGTNLTDVGQSIAEQMAKEEANNATRREESKTEAVRSPQTSIN